MTTNETRSTCIWDNCNQDAIYCEGHAKEAFGPAEQVKLLKAKLRAYAIAKITRGPDMIWYQCGECKRKWIDKPEQHNAGCICAP